MAQALCYVPHHLGVYYATCHPSIAVGQVLLAPDGRDAMVLPAIKNRKAPRMPLAYEGFFDTSHLSIRERSVMKNPKKETQPEA